VTRPEYWKDCTINCERIVECAVCRCPKPPVGRDVPLSRGGSYCQHECEGHNKGPIGGHLWPGELADMDREETT